MKIEIDGEEVLNMTKSAEHLGVAKTTFKIYTREKRVPEPIDAGGYLFWKVKDLDEVVRPLMKKRRDDRD